MSSPYHDGFFFRPFKLMSTQLIAFQVESHEDRLFLDEADFSVEVARFCGGKVPPGKGFCAGGGGSVEVLGGRAMRTVELRDLGRMRNHSGLVAVQVRAGWGGARAGGSEI